MKITILCLSLLLIDFIIYLWFKSINKKSLEQDNFCNKISIVQLIVNISIILMNIVGLILCCIKIFTIFEILWFNLIVDILTVIAFDLKQFNKTIIKINER